MAQITPPVGFNLSCCRTEPAETASRVARAALPVFFLLVVAVAIITIFPGIALLLPKLAFPD
jgi:TRAP-type C4-dicarboxylate transport system permease large subunit